MAERRDAVVGDPSGDVHAELRRRWLARWPEALAAWGRPTRMHAPVLGGGGSEAVGSFAWFSPGDVEIGIDLDLVRRMGLEDHAVAILAHEVGHHVLAPGDLLTSARVAARVRLGLGGVDRMVPVVSNLWTDLLINDRLQRRTEVDMVALWQAIGRPGEADPLMQLMMRTDELLWQLPRGTLVDPTADVPEDAALLCHRLVRVYARDPVGGAAGFAALLRSTLPEDLFDDGGEDGTTTSAAATCTQHDQGDQVPAGLASDQSLGAPVLHPAVDPAVVGPPAQSTAAGPDPGARGAGGGGQGSGGIGGQALSAADLHAVLRSLGSSASQSDVTVAWYREHAAPYVVPFPSAPRPSVAEPLLGGLAPWEVGDDLAELDWTGTIGVSPVVVPGITTMRRDVHEDPPVEENEEPLDLDLYLDSSGSMPDPARQGAPIALAGAVLALSALRAGARVQATTWSGPGQIVGTDGFTRDATEVLRVVVARIGGGTAFPVPLLERTHLGDPESGAGPTRTRPAHIAVISDDGITTMVDHPSRPPTVVARALEAAGGGGTLVLQASQEWVDRFTPSAQGFDVHSVRTAEDLLSFTREFARRLWTRQGRSRAR